jgi:hypothetical protein
MTKNGHAYCTNCTTLFCIGAPNPEKLAAAGTMVFNAGCRLFAAAHWVKPA